MNTDTILSLVPTGTSVPTALLSLLAFLATVIVLIAVGLIVVKVVSVLPIREDEPMETIHIIRGVQ